MIALQYSGWLQYSIAFQYLQYDVMASATHQHESLIGIHMSSPS